MTYPEFRERIETVKENIQKSKNPVRIANFLRASFVNDTLVSFQKGEITENESVNLTIMFDEMLMGVVNEEEPFFWKSVLPTKTIQS